MILSDEEHEKVTQHSLANHAPESIVVQGIIETGFKQFVKDHEFEGT